MPKRRAGRVFGGNPTPIPRGKWIRVPGQGSGSTTNPYRGQLILLNFAEKKGHAPRPDNFRCYVKESPPARKTSGFIPKCRNTAPEEFLGVTPPPYPGVNGSVSGEDPEAPQPHTRRQLILLNFAEKKGHTPRPDNFRCYVKESPPARTVSGFVPKRRNTAPEEVLG